VQAHLPAARAWFLTAWLGQTIFFLYIVIFYASAVLAGDLSRWAKVLPKGLVAGDTWGNLSLASHLALSAFITVAGPLQVIPRLRARLPRLHRWIGRLYIPTALILSLTGLYLIWFKGTVGGTVQHLGTSFNALLIVACSILAWRSARARDFVAHRRWALRLFLVVSGVWFFRVGLMFWILANRGPAGFDPKTFLGPFLDILTFAQTLVPLAALELYFRASASSSKTLRLATAGAMCAFTAITAIGITGATMFMWWPRMRVF
jgi:hypothetical protein